MSFRPGIEQRRAFDRAHIVAGGLFVGQSIEGTLGGLGAVLNYFFRCRSATAKRLPKVMGDLREFHDARFFNCLQGFADSSVQLGPFGRRESFVQSLPEERVTEPNARRCSKDANENTGRTSLRYCRVDSVGSFAYQPKHL